MKIMVFDIGGSSVKAWTTLVAEPKKFDTGEEFCPADFVEATKNVRAEIEPDRISIGYPGLVRWGRPAEEPINLGKGWVGFDFAQAFDRPVRIMNDADMQAMGGYEGGRMLYLGLGTGLGTSLITESGINQLALGLLPYKDGKAFRDFLTKGAIKELGLAKWQEAVFDAASLLKKATLADYVLLGGGGVEHLSQLPEGCRRGGNVHAYFGGLRMWEDCVHGSTVLRRNP